MAGHTKKLPPQNGKETNDGQSRENGEMEMVIRKGKAGNSHMNAI